MPPFLVDAKDILEVGCGSGWMSYLLSKMGFHVTGIDLNKKDFTVPDNQDVKLVEGNVYSMPFNDKAFDSVVCFSVIEHIEQPDKAFLEFDRVLKPGGNIIIVSPNMISPLYSLRSIYLNLFKIKNKSGHDFPFGNTIQESLWSLIKNVSLLIYKYFNPKFSPIFRKPDLNPPFCSDNDSVYLVNPIDVSRFFCQFDYKIIKNGRPKRSSLFNLVRGSTWVVLKKIKQ